MSIFLFIKNINEIRESLLFIQSNPSAMKGIYSEWYED